MSRIVKLAITGSIGSGKSVVSRMMNVLGVPVYDCDANAKRLMTENEYIVSELKRMFGEECYEEDGTLNRQYIAARIFPTSILEGLRTTFFTSGDVETSFKGAYPPLLATISL